MDTADFAYDLPPHLIAQHPCEPRDAARLLVAGTTSGAIAHRRVADLPDLLRPGDLVVLNRTRVFRARLAARKRSGGALEVLLIHPLTTPGNSALSTGSRTADAEIPRPLWRCLMRGSVKPGTTLRIQARGDDHGNDAVRGQADDLADAEVLSCDADGSRVIAFAAGTDVWALCERAGTVPLPPYITRPATEDDALRYQTVFGDRVGSVAAPTASLHLTEALFARLSERGIATTQVELAIGPGTFRPVDTPRIEDFAIHAEHAICPPDTLAAIAACRARGGRVVAIGTTVVRTLETAAAQPGGLAPFSGWTRLFLHPPQQLRVVDALLTNFHLPRSSLLTLVACLTGVPRLRQLYAAAIAERYRFFSYGDAMLLLPPQSDGLAGAAR